MLERLPRCPPTVAPDDAGASPQSLYDEVIVQMRVHRPVDDGDESSAVAPPSTPPRPSGSTAGGAPPGDRHGDWQADVWVDTHHSAAGTERYQNIGWVALTSWMRVMGSEDLHCPELTFYEADPKGGRGRAFALAGSGWRRRAASAMQAAAQKFVVGDTAQATISDYEAALDSFLLQASLYGNAALAQSQRVPSTCVAGAGGAAPKRARTESSPPRIRVCSPVRS